MLYKMPHSFGVVISPVPAFNGDTTAVDQVLEFMVSFGGE
jgi:hypothetical protein